MKYSTNYHIPKPELTDEFNIEDLHGIIDQVDTLTKQSETDINTFETEEAARKANEVVRQADESTRQFNESNRNNTFTELETNMANSINALNNTNTTSTEQESARVEAEKNRVAEYEGLKTSLLNAQLTQSVNIAVTRPGIVLNPLESYNYTSGNVINSDVLITLDIENTELITATQLQISNNKIYTKTLLGEQISKFIKDILLFQ